MLTILNSYKKVKQLRSGIKPKKSDDIVVIKPITTIEVKKDKSIIQKRTFEKINLTRKINETAKLLKNENAQNNLERIKEIFKA